MKNQMLKRALTIMVVIMVSILSCIIGKGSFAEKTYIKSKGQETATIQSIRSSGNSLYVSVLYKNNGTKASSFINTFKFTIWQKGRECEDDYFNERNQNESENIKDGASIVVTYVFKLRDVNSLVEIDLGVWFSLSEDVVVYFNPKTQKWGTKIEASDSPTPTIAKPTKTPAPTPAKEEFKNKEELGNSDENWICPSCGKILKSKFCPDCGIASPSPEPTPTPTPEPTPVPMDITKPVQNVVKYPYAIIEEDGNKEGLYTGELVDGFPHGYGVFECDEFVFIGEWCCGYATEEGHRLDKKFEITSDNIDKWLNIQFYGIRKSNNYLTLPYSVELMENYRETIKGNYTQIVLRITVRIYKKASERELIKEAASAVTLYNYSDYKNTGKFNATIKDMLDESDYDYEYEVELVSLL